MPFLLNQTNFTHGEFSELMIARNDIDIYSKAAWRLRNLVVVPQGGAKKRFGTTFIESIGDISSDECMLIPFEHDNTDKYLLVLTDLNMAIYYNDTKVADVVTPYPGSILTNLELKYAEFHESLIIVHPEYEPRELIRITAHTGWTFDPIEFKNLPTYDFDRNYDTISFSLDSVEVGDSRTLTADATIFTAEYVGGLFIGLGPNLEDGYGISRITSFTSGTEVEVTIISKFDDSYTSSQIGSSIQLTVPAWSTARGWPKTATYFENRLIFGGSKSLPQAIFMSVTYDKYDFDTGRGYADNAIILEIGTNKLNVINNIISSNTLQILTTTGEFAALNQNGQPLQPGQVSVKKQSGNGSENCLPHILNNQTFYIKRGGKGVMNFIFIEGSLSYQSIEVSVVSSHLIVNPIDSAVLSGSILDDANYFLLINSDGTLAVYQTLVEEKISAWSLSDTESNSTGKFKRIASLGDDVYFIIERTNDDGTYKYIEKLDWDVYTDSSLEFNYGVPTDVITGLDHLEGLLVSIVGDGYVLTDRVVSGGEITLENEVSNAEVGLLYKPLLRTLPIAINGPVGNIAYSSKKIFTVYVDYYNSVGIYINGELIPFRTFGNQFPYDPPTGESGIYEHVNFGQWSARQYVELTQEDPLPMTIRGLGYKIEV